MKRQPKEIAPNLFRMSRPPSMFWCKQQGFDVVICFQSGIFELFSNTLYERQFDHDFGVRRYDIKCSDFWPPSPWAMSAAMRIVDDALARGEKVGFHCMSGVDRTGRFAMKWRMQRQGWTFVDAYREWVREGRHFWYDWWKYSAKRWELPLIERLRLQAREERR